MQIKAVSVIEMTNGDLQSVRSFTDDAPGNLEAEELFTKCLKENATLDDDEIEACLDDGHYSSNGYEIFLTHSETPTKK